MSTSLDHTIHFHRPIRSPNEWLLFHNETTCSSGARGIARTEVWDAEGFLVASILQEGLVRPNRGWEPEVDPKESLRAEILNSRGSLGDIAAEIPKAKL